MEIELDRDGDVPLAVQLTWALRARILSGELAAGLRLPGVRDLAVATGVNVNTVRAVYARLEAEGLVAAEHGRGTFVSGDAPSDARLADVTGRALEAAQAAGLDPREVAAALYSGLASAPASEGDAGERRRLREEIGRLELALAERRLVRRLGPPDEDLAALPLPQQAGRMLTAVELRAQRDDLAARLQLLTEADEVAAAEPSETPQADVVPPARASTSTRSSTAPGLRWTPSFGR